jgi:iron(III) transport system substrate-binding protein
MNRLRSARLSASMRRRPAPWGRFIFRLASIAAILAAAALAAAIAYAHYLDRYSDIVAAARQEKVLVAYSTVHDDAALAELMKAFNRRYPFIEIDNTDGDSARTYQRFTQEVTSGKPSADFLWGPAMDLQEKLINDGFAQPYTSPQMPFLPSWAHWKDLGYGVTLEPIAFVYNRKYLSAEEMPHTHSGLRDLLRRNQKRFEGRVALYNPERSEVGMLLSSQDIRVTRDAWDLFDTFGQVKAVGYGTSRQMLDHIVSGDQWIGYDAIASYALEMRKANPELVIVYPSDYVLVMSRVAFIAASARHPNAARLFLDFLLSQEAQTILKMHGMGSVREDVGVPSEQSLLNSARTQAIRIGPGLLADLDSLVRMQFLRRWPKLPSAGDYENGAVEVTVPRHPLPAGPPARPGTL